MANRLPTDPNADPMFPEEIGSARRADLVIRKTDRVENQVTSPHVDKADLKEVPIKVKRDGDLRVEVSTNRIFVYFGEKRIFICWWKPQADQFQIYQRVNMKGVEQKPLQYFADMEDAWQECGKHHVRPDEFHEAFSGVKPPVEWNFQECPFNSVECKFKYGGDPRSGSMPALICRRCNSKFAMANDGSTKLIERGEDPDCPDTTSSAPVVKPKRKRSRSTK